MIIVDAYSRQAIQIQILDQQGLPLQNLAAVSGVQFQADGPAKISPVVCTVADAATALIDVPLNPAQLAVAGSYKTEIQALWGASPITTKGEMLINAARMKAVEVVQGDAPTITIDAGVDMTTAVVGFVWSSSPAGFEAAIDGMVTVATTQATIGLTALDTASVGSMYGRLTVDAQSTALLRIDVVAQVIV